MDSGVNKTFSHDPRPRLQSSPSPIIVHENLVTPSEQNSRKALEKPANGIQKMFNNKKLEGKPRFMSEKRTRVEVEKQKEKEKKPEGKSQRRASADPKVAPKIKKMLVPNPIKEEDIQNYTPTSNHTAKFPTYEHNSPATKSQNGGNAGYQPVKKHDMGSIRESRESSEVSINSFNPPKGFNSGHRFASSKDSADIKDVIALKEDPLEYENHSTVHKDQSKKPTLSKQTLNKRSPNPSKPSESVFSPN